MTVKQWAIAEDLKSGTSLTSEAVIIRQREEIERLRDALTQIREHPATVEGMRKFVEEVLKDG